MKFLLWIAVIFALLWFFRSKKQSRNSAASQSKAADSAPSAGRQAEPMLKCSKCGVYLPASEAVTGTEGRMFCCEEHRASSTS